MEHNEITNINELAELMDEEAEKWGRQDDTNATVNGRGILEQWNNRSERTYLDMPMCIHAIIYKDEVVEHADGSIGMTFQLYSLYFDDDGARVERPAEQLAALAAEQDNG